MRLRFAVVVLVAAAALAFGAAGAGAHSSLEASDPAAGSVLDDPPDQVLLEFDEPVEATLGGIRVFDADAERVDDGEITRPGGDHTLATPLPELADGTYVVTYRVVSADSHPIDGAFTFQVGAGAPATDTDALVDQLLAAEGGDPLAGSLYAVARTLLFLGVAGFVGTLGFVLLVRPSVLDARLGLGVLRGSWLVLVVASASVIALQGVTAAALPLTDVFDPSVWSAVVDTRFGTLAAFRLVLLLLVGLPLLLPSRFSTRPTRAPGTGPGGGDREPEGGAPCLPGWWRVLAVVVMAATVLSVALAGHAGAGSYVAFWALVDGTHLAAMALWLGGLVLLATLVLGHAPAGDPAVDIDAGVDAVPDSEGDEGSAAAADDANDADVETGDGSAWAHTERFSTVALVCVALLVLTGSLQSWRQVGGLDALTSTTYGRVLMLKLFLVLIVIAVAAFSRSILRDRRRATRAERRPAVVGPGAMTAGSGADRAQLRSSVVAEIAIGVLVLVASAFLVDLVPARDALAEPYDTVVEAEGIRVDVIVDPATSGPVDLHFYVFSGGPDPVDVASLDASIVLADEDIGPLELPLQRAGPNHFSAYAFDIPIAGEWELDLDVRPTGGGVVEASTTVPIR